MSKYTLLLVDDDSDLLLSLSKSLSSLAEGLRVQAVTSAEKAKDILLKESVAVAVVDLSLNPQDGVESGFSLISDIRAISPNTRVLVLTGEGSLDNGVKAISLGASSFLEKPPSLSHLNALIQDATRQYELRVALDALRAKENQDMLSAKVIGRSEAAARLREDIAFAARGEQPVFLRGETGVGKSFCASLIHSLSRRAGEAFVRYQPNFLGADLIASELFGHKKGAFTGAENDREGLLLKASSGSFFLDEIDALPVPIQVTLLSTLQEKIVRPVGSDKEVEVYFRLISASNADVEKAISSGSLRADFYHRVAVSTVFIPALRERKEDIEELSSEYLKSLSEKQELSSLTLSKDALSILHAYDFPGNIRELEGLLQEGAYRADARGDTQINASDIRISGRVSSEVAPKSLKDLVSAYRKKVAKEALARNSGNILATARELEVDRNTLKKALKG